ncbi:MAG: hypothetical protein M1818_005693 [Claussenomyces sp. TS43310]|nr:MAG: hypothetical protein M1818_005693 [Claussenomyces sp. TS43310]
MSAEPEKADASVTAEEVEMTEAQQRSALKMAGNETLGMVTRSVQDQAKPACRAMQCMAPERLSAPPPYAACAIFRSDPSQPHLAAADARSIPRSSSPSPLFAPARYCFHSWEKKLLRADQLATGNCRQDSDPGCAAGGRRHTSMPPGAPRQLSSRQRKAFE